MSLLLASWIGDQFVNGIFYMVLFLAMVIHYGKRFGNANPEIKDAAKKAAVSKTIQLIGRIIR